MPRVILFLFLAVLAAVPAGSAQGTDPKVAELTVKFERRLTELARGLDGVAGIGIKDLTSGYEFYLNGDVVFPQASAIKIPILLKLFESAEKRKLRLDESVPVRAADFAPGSGVLRELGDATASLTLADLAVLMIVLSDNTATNILIDRVGGLEAVNALLDRWGFTHTRLNRKMGTYAGPDAPRDSTSTPHEMVELLEKLQRGELLDAAHTRRALDILKKPKRSALRAALPAGVEVANKTGSLPGVRCDSGIVYLGERAYILTLSTTYLRSDADGEKFIEEVSRTAYDYLARLAGSNPYGRRLR